mgnify:CR=1 FL=1
MPRYIELDDWIFEVKAVRAIRSNRYGDQYSAIAHFNLNADKVYIDGLMTREQEKFSAKDFLTFKQFCRQLGVKQANFDRYKQGRFVAESIIVEPEPSSSILQLVK